MDRPPLLHLRSWASVQADRKRKKAPARAYTIMAKPRGQFGELGDGRVPWLVPTMAARDLLDEALAARGTPAEAATEEPTHG